MSVCLPRIVPCNRDPEIGDAHGAAVVDQHVGWFQVAMEHALRMGGGQPGA